MLTLDRIYHASYVLKDVIRPTHLVKASGMMFTSSLKTCRSPARSR